MRGAEGKAEKRYDVGVYLRLSRDDAGVGDGMKAESESIRSQRELAKAFICGRDDMQIYDFYCDDGYSGVNFDRPEFQRMMTDVRAGKVNCIVVKDLSRFGRDYIEAGRLIQKTFPALHVRFVAVADHFDSLTADDNERSLILPVRNFINDAYCRDISVKVRSHQQVMRENGQFIGAFAAYGYRRDEQNKNKLVPDVYAAHIVKHIFAWKLQGMSMAAIADGLNQMGVLSPMAYKRSIGLRYSTGFADGVHAKWSPAAVKRILGNELYVGTMVQGRSEKINYKLKQCMRKGKENWVRVEHTHEPIIKKEEFETVQRLLAAVSHMRKKEGEPYLFSGLLFCGDCMKPMIRRKNRWRGGEKICLICSAGNRGDGCTRHNISEEALRESVLTAVRVQAALLLDKAEVLSRIGQIRADTGEMAVFAREIARLRQAEAYDRSLQDGLYEDRKNGVITEEDAAVFRSIYEEQCAQTREAIRKQEEAMRRLFHCAAAAQRRLEWFRERPEVVQLDRNVLVSFIDRILVYEDKRICIEWKAGEAFGRSLTVQKGGDIDGGSA